MKNRIQQVEERLLAYKTAADEAYARLRADIFEILTASEEGADTPTSANFINALTENERNALWSVCTSLSSDGSGNVSIVKLMQKTGLSRPVYTNLFVKMEKYNMASIENQVVKGTHVILHAPDLIQMGEN